MTEFKVGDKVRVRVSEHTREELHGLEGEVTKVILAPSLTLHIVLPKHNLMSQGYPADYCWGFSGSYAGTYTVYDRLELISSTSPTIGGIGRLEKPCQVCKRNNDLGTRVCWLCGNQPF